MNNRSWDKLEEKRPFPESRKKHLTSPQWERVDRWIASLEEPDLIIPSGKTIKMLHSYALIHWGMV